MTGGDWAGVDGHPPACDPDRAGDLLTAAHPALSPAAPVGLCRAERGRRPRLPAAAGVVALWAVAGVCRPGASVATTGVYP